MSNLIKLQKEKLIVDDIYDISNKDYHSGPGISRSGLMKFKDSPYKYWNKYINPNREPDKPTAAMILGSFFHTLVLEPHLLEESFFIDLETEKLDDEDKKDKEKKKALKEKKDNLKEEKKQAIKIGKLIISQKEVNRAYAMLESLKKVDGGKIYEHIKKNAAIEKSIYWTDKETGILCKCRPDILYGRIAIDLKTTSNSSPRGFSKISYDKGYHIQAGMVKEGLKVTKGIDIISYRFIAVETANPYIVTNPPASENYIEAGLNEFKYLLSKYKKCLETDTWPYYQDEEIQIPRYASY